jgi:hypothetical protein
VLGEWLQRSGVPFCGPEGAGGCWVVGSGVFDRVGGRSEESRREECDELHGVVIGRAEWIASTVSRRSRLKLNRTICIRQATYILHTPPIRPRACFLSFS